MTHTTRSLNAFVLFVGSLSAGFGCATTAAAGHRDVHGTATFPGGGGDGRLLVLGPAVLMHVDLDAGDDVLLYTVARDRGTDADCAAVPDAGPVRLRAGESNRLNLAVAGGRVLCIAAPRARTSLLWHTKTGEPDAPEPREQMLATSHR